jgi:hypothetical protein
MSVVACADSFAWFISLSLAGVAVDVPTPGSLVMSPALAARGARKRRALTNTINNRSFMSRLLESGAAVSSLLENRSV